MIYSLAPLISALRTEDTASPAALALAEIARKAIAELIQALIEALKNAEEQVSEMLNMLRERLEAMREKKQYQKSNIWEDMP